MNTISAVYSEGRIVVPAQSDADSLYQDGYGSRVDAKVLALEPYEALYLVERGKVAVVDEATGRRLVLQELLWKLSPKDPNLWTKYLVYRDLRTRGFVAKGGPGLGVDFNVYERGAYGKKRPSYVVYAVWEGAPEAIGGLEKVLEEVEGSGKSLRLAVVDRRGEVVYYTLSEMDFGKGEEPEDGP